MSHSLDELKTMLRKLRTEHCPPVSRMRKHEVVMELERFKNISGSGSGGSGSGLSTELPSHSTKSVKDSVHEEPEEIPMKSVKPQKSGKPVSKISITKALEESDEKPDIPMKSGKFQKSGKKTTEKNEVVEEPPRRRRGRPRLE